jgi:hypothetical protein
MNVFLNAIRNINNLGQSFDGDDELAAMSIINAPPASFHVLGTIIATTDHLTTEGIINQILLGEEHRIRESGTTARECILREKSIL